jgi:hypothetical protein
MNNACPLSLRSIAGVLGVCALLVLAGCDQTVPPESLHETMRETAREPAAEQLAQAPRITFTQRDVIGSGLAQDAAKNSAQKTASAAQAAKPEHEPLFVDWPRPQMALVLTGQQMGYIEPCGCTGLANQKGGLARRHTFIKQLAAKGWPLVSLDVGNQVRRFGRQAEIKFQMAVAGLKQIGYSGITFGPDDLRLSIGELVAATVAEDPQDSPFLCANVAIIDESLLSKFRVFKSGGKTIGVTAVLGDEERKAIRSDEIIHTPVEDALKALWPAMKAAKCDVYVLLAHASLEETAIIAQKFPVFDIVVTAGGGGEPTFQPEKIPHTKSLMVQVGTKGMYAGVIGVYDDPAKRFRYQRVPLDDRFTDSQDMLDLMASYQDQLREAGLEGLGLKPLAHPSGHTFVGSKACADCHSTAYAIWEKTPHAHATDSLVHPGERSDIPRHHDPECLSCHVTGWNAQKYFPYLSGYEDLERSLSMHGSGCENCHGPGSAHVAVESGDLDATPAQRQKLMEGMRLPLAEAERRCMECHDHDNSPDFHVRGAFEKYWEKVKHEGKD